MIDFKLDLLSFVVDGHHISVVKEYRNLTVTCECPIACKSVLKLLEFKDVHETKVGDLTTLKRWMQETDVGDALREYRQSNTSNTDGTWNVLVAALKD